MNSVKATIVNELRYCTWKHNLIASSLVRHYVKSRAKNIQTLIFTATTGRSGTKTLVKVFSTIDGCVSYHEPQPAMYGEQLVNRNDFYDPYTRFIYKYVKSVNIRRFAKGAKYYFEANHLFIKSFHDYVIEDFKGKVKVIHLYRDPIKVANSLFSTRGPRGLSNCPGIEEGNEWWLDYHSPNNKIQIADVLDNDKNFKHNFYKCLWYWYEIEARVNFWRSYYTQVPFVDFRTEDIADVEKLINLMDKLEVPYCKEKLISVSKARLNLKTSDKTKPPIDIIEAKKMHDNFREMLIKEGYKLTDYPAPDYHLPQRCSKLMNQ